MTQKVQTIKAFPDACITPEDSEKDDRISNGLVIERRNDSPMWWDKAMTRAVGDTRAEVSPKGVDSTVTPAIVTTGPTVAVIGCGPGGMFFLHAIERKRRELLAKYMDDDSLSLDGKKILEEKLTKLPNATCFERADAPGGVWRTERVENGAPNMYEGLWTNGLKEFMEFFDYTFQDHFHQSTKTSTTTTTTARELPAYMPRAAILEYIVARVTRSSPNLFRDRVRFQTQVEHVSYSEELNAFEVVTKNLSTSQTTTSYYDKVLWAAGQNGKKVMPKSVLTKLEGFSGRIIHSSETHNLKDDVQGKNVLMVGGSYSAEDLALMAIKLGVKHVHVVSRSSFTHMDGYQTWPQNCVSVYSGRTPVGANGRNVCIGSIEWKGSEGIYHIEESDTFTLTDIDTIVLTTGYQRSIDMLDPELQEVFEPGDWVELDERLPDGFAVDDHWLNKELDCDIPIQVDHYHDEILPYTWKDCMSIDCPNFFFMNEGSISDYPLLELDAKAWMVLSIITGEANVPGSEAEMEAAMKEDLLKNVKKYPHYRLVVDSGYYDAMAALTKKMNASEKRQIYSRLGREQRNEQNYALAEYLRETRYGLQLIDKQGALTEQGETFFNNAAIDNIYFGDTHLTFRDNKETMNATSVFTGAKASVLPIPWFEIDGDGTELILGRPATSSFTPTMTTLPKNPIESQEDVWVVLDRMNPARSPCA